MLTLIIVLIIINYTAEKATQLFELSMPFKAFNKEIISEPHYHYHIAIIQYDNKHMSSFCSICIAP